jgi:hypothetical protein
MSSLTRHLIAGVSAAATIVGGALMLVGVPYASLVFLSGFLVPVAFFIFHLNLTTELTVPEKAVWRRDLWIGWRAAAAMWSYLLASDLKRESKERLDALDS